MKKPQRSGVKEKKKKFHQLRLQISVWFIGLLLLSMVITTVINGLFLEQRLEHLHELAPQLSDKEQTLAVLGFDRTDLLRLVDCLPPRAIDRIVPFGQALSFAPVWDGMDLITAFTRQISLPPAPRHIQPPHQPQQES